MPVWYVRGGNALDGRVTVQGAKNAVLPIMAACLLSGGVSKLENCPLLSDVDVSVEILRHLGCSVMQNGREILVDSAGMTGCCVPHDLMLKMRSSVFYLGAILARCGQVRLSAPGGCELGSRPIDLHLKALEALGAEIGQCGGEILCRGTLHGCHINLDFPSVGATENVILAACAAKGTTVLTNAAREPEIVDLQNYLNAAGANIHGAGTAEISIDGFSPRPFTEYRIMPDRIAAATYLCAAAAAGGDVLLERVCPAHTETVTEALSRMGCIVSAHSDTIRLRRGDSLRAGRPMITKPYPGFPTDAQALLMSAALKADGTTVFVENIFENRFRHVPELRRMGADIRTEGRVAMVTGVPKLCGASVAAEDLRGGAALAIAALSAAGETKIIDPGHVERGYCAFAETLQSIGGDIRREADF